MSAITSCSRGGHADRLERAGAARCTTNCAICEKSVLVIRGGSTRVPAATDANRANEVVERGVLENESGNAGIHELRDLLVDRQEIHDDDVGVRHLLRMDSARRRQLTSCSPMSRRTTSASRP